MDDDFRIGAWLVQPSLNTVSHNGTTAHLEPKVMAVLVCLAGRAGETIRKEQLLEEVWADTFVTEGVLVRSISELRRVFEDDAKESQIIQTIAKRGYRLVAPVVRGNGAPLSEVPIPQVPAAPANGRADGRRTWLGRAAVLGGLALMLALLVASNAGGLWDRFLRRTAPTIRSLAVLPLRNLSDDPAQNYFSSGMTDELISALSQISAIRVISYTSVRRYENSNKPLPQIAQELGVDGIVEGTMQRVGDRVRITAQLIYAPQESHLWAHSYEREVRDVFGLESELAQQIAQEIQARITPREQGRLTSTRPMNLKAVESYLEAQYHWQKADRENFKRGLESSVEDERKRALALYEETIAADPNFAPAYVGVAYFYNPPLSVHRDVPKAIAAATKAIELDPQLADAHLALADIKQSAQWDWKGAEQEYRRAVELNANLAGAHDGLAFFLDSMGRLDEGMAEHQRAEQLEPGLDHLSGAFCNRQDFERAIVFERAAAEQDPNWFGHYWFLGVEYERLGREKEAVAEFQKTQALLDDRDLARAFGAEYKRRGFRAAMHLWATRVEPLADKGYLPDFAMIYLYGTAGDRERAFTWLERAYRERDGELANLKVSAHFDCIRSDPRFAEYVRKVGLPQ